MRAGSIRYQNHSIYYQQFAEHNNTGAPILLLGGVLQNKASWEGYIRDISPVNSLITVDLPGIGEAGILDATQSFDFLADCIHELLLHLETPKINIFATSYSSIIAYEFSAKYTKYVDKLVISSSMASLPGKQKSVMEACIDALRNNDSELFRKTFTDGVCHPDKTIHNYDLSRKVIDRLMNSLTKNEVSQFIENTKRVLNYSTTANKDSKIGLSPLLFTGAYDVFTPPEQCKEIGKFYAGSYFGTIDNYDHLFHIGNRKAIIDSILPFFREEKIPSFATYILTD